ncbi:MAG TPA: hypothetical protein VM118_04850, partial [Acidobacteriota bacterium]|nr:hypothetical protein [Acidobacteriota bacterium]
ANPGGVNMETLTILNLGNDDMEGDITVTAGDTWLSVSEPGSYYMWAGGNDIVMDVTMDATCLTQGLYVGEIHVTHNDTSKVSPRVYPIEFFVVTDFKCPQDEVLKTAVASPGVLSLEVGSYGRFASQNDEGGFWRFVDSSSTIFDASLLLAYGDQPTETGDTIVFHRFYSSSDPGQGGLRAVTDLVIDSSAYGTGNGFAKASSELHTHAEGLWPDSAIAVRVEWFFPQKPVYGDFVIAKYMVWNRTGSPISDVVVGLWTDVDVIEAAHMDGLQRGVDNHGNYVQAQNLIYQFGYDTIGHVPSDYLNSAQRYSGGISYLAGRDVAGAAFELVSAFIRGAVGDNRDNTEPGRPNSGFFYRTVVGDTGVSVWEPTAHTDSAKDCYTWLLLDQNRTLEANAANPEVYVVAWVSDTLQHDAYSIGPKLVGGLGAVVDSAWSWVNQYQPYVLCECSNLGDPSYPIALGPDPLDVVWAARVAFRGYPQVFDDDCPYARTDVDCNGFTNVIDVVKIVNVVYRDGDPAVQFCRGCLWHPDAVLSDGGQSLGTF